MNKRTRSMLVAVAGVASIALALTGCSSNGSSNGSTSSAKKTVVFVSTTPQGDDSGVDDIVAGLKKLKSDTGVTTKFVESTDPSGYEASVRNVAQSGATIVIGAFPDITNAMNTVAPTFPKTQFVQVFADPPKPAIANKTTVSFDVYKALYLSGYTAASLTKSKVIGWIGGAGSPLLYANFHAYQAGAKAANPDVKVLNGIVGSFSDPAKARDIALGMTSQGADFLQTDAGGSSTGIIQAAASSGALVLTDASESVAKANPKTVVGLTYLRFGDAMRVAVEKVLKDKKGIGTYAADLDKDLVGVQIEDSFLNGGSDRAADVQAFQPKLDDLKKKIIDGSVKVPYNPNGI